MTNFDDLPEFGGTVVLRADTVEYNHANYQYASTSQPGHLIQPAVIVYVTSDEDIVKAINYAKKKDIAISVRSGGHHYIGASSCAGNNILLDFSGKRWDDEKEGKPYPYHFFEYNEGPDNPEKIIEVGPAITLGYFGKQLHANGMFCPFGECPDVHLGGHCQTGGASSISPSFGMLCDRVHAIHIFCADGDGDSVAQKHYITRDTKDPYLADIFFSTLGGSPGNFGVVTRYEIKPWIDADYPDARGCILTMPYTKERFRKYLELFAEFSDSPLTVDYSYTLMVSASSIVCDPDTRDHGMMVDDPLDFFGKDFSDEEKKFMTDPMKSPIPLVVVYGLWGNIEDKTPYDQNDTAKASMAFFKRLRDTGKPDSVLDRSMCWLVDKMMKKKKIAFDENAPMPVSQMMLHWTVPLIREWLLPFKKFNCLGNRKDLATNGFTSYVSDRVDEIVGNNLAAQERRCRSFPQFSSAGPAYFNPPDDKCSVSWRTQTTGFIGLTCFYHPDVKKSVDFANEWFGRHVATCCGDDGNYCKDADHRFIWAPRVGPKTLNEWNMDEEWESFFDSKEKYERILSTKRRVDPHDVFTPNLFCVGASTCAKLQRNTAVQASVPLRGISDQKMLAKTTTGGGLAISTAYDPKERVRHMLEVSKNGEVTGVRPLAKSTPLPVAEYANSTDSVEVVIAAELPKSETKSRLFLMRLVSCLPCCCGSYSSQS